MESMASFSPLPVLFLFGRYAEALHAGRPFIKRNLRRLTRRFPPFAGNASSSLMLNLMLRQNIDSAPGWVTKARAHFGNDSRCLSRSRPMRAEEGTYLAHC